MFPVIAPAAAPPVALGVVVPPVPPHAARVGAPRTPRPLAARTGRGAMVGLRGGPRRGPPPAGPCLREGGVAARQRHERPDDGVIVERKPALDERPAVSTKPPAADP